MVAAHARHPLLLKSARHKNKKHKLTHHYHLVEQVQVAVDRGPGVLVSDPGVCGHHRETLGPQLMLAGKGGGAGAWEESTFQPELVGERQAPPTARGGYQAQKHWGVGLLRGEGGRQRAGGGGPRAHWMHRDSSGEQ